MSKRAPVQGEHVARGIDIPAGTIGWDEHLQAYRVYAKRYGTNQTAERIAERGGFGFFELVMFLQCKPSTWEPRKQ